MNSKFIPTKVHGALDYIVAVALFFAPNIFMFNDVGGAAVLVPRILGVGLLLYSLLTNYEWGVFKAIPMRVHLAFDTIAALFLAASPFLFGFADEKVNAWLPHVVVGLAVILVVICSKSNPSREASPITDL